MLGSTLFFLGELASARTHLEQGSALYDPQRYRSRALSSGLDPGVVSLSRLAWTLWMLGYPDQALTRSQEALTLAQQLSHPYSLGFALHYAAVLHQSRREAQLVREWADATIAHSREQGFIQWLEGGIILRGWALVEQGLVEEGIAQLREALTAKRAKGTDLGQAHGLGRLAEVYGKAGQVEEGLRVLAEALAAVHNNNSARYFEAELYRLKGELLLQQTVRRGVPVEPVLLAEAEACFHQALDVARHQGAKSLELRAVMSLSRLWQQQGKRAAAHQMLAEIYGWFTEGFDTPDLQEAQALLTALVN